MLDPSHIEGFVLAGGSSRRFGRDKALEVHDGLSLVERNAAVLGERYAKVSVVSAPGRSYDDLGLTTVFDEWPGHGPLAGIHAALKLARTDVIAVAAVDLIGLRSAWYQQLEAGWVDGAAAFRDHHWHPLVALYHREILPVVEARLQAGRLAVRDLLDEVGHAIVCPPDFADLRNANTPEEL